MDQDKVNQYPANMNETGFRAGKYEPERVERLLEALKAKCGRVNAAKAAGIGYDTFLRWMREKQDFSEAVKKAEEFWKEDMKGSCVQKLMQIGFEKNNPLPLFFLLKSYFPDQFGDKILTQHSGYIEGSETDEDKRTRSEKLKIYLAELKRKLHSEKDVKVA